MKSRRLISMLLSAALVMPMFSGIVFADTSGVAIDETNFPDANFRSYVFSHCDSNDDGYLSETEIANVTEFNLYYENIGSLKGIEYFTSLRYLACYGNNITVLDVSHNTALDSLYCFDNSLTNLDVSHNTALTYLACYDNSLTNLDVSHNTALKNLYCNNNNLTTLDVSYNTALTDLYCINNNLTSLDVSNNTALKILECSNNNLISLDVSLNTALSTLLCDNNNLTSLDVSNNTALSTLWCNNNNLTSLDVSNNTLLRELRCGNNNLTILGVSNNTALKDLYCNNNKLTSLDVSDSRALYYLDCHDNKLTSLDVSDSRALYYLDCHDNNLTSLDISNNATLIYIFNNGDKNTYDTTVVWDEKATSRELYVDKNMKVTANGNVLYDGTVTPTPTATPTPTSRPTATPTATPVPTQAPSSGMTAFAERLYTEALGRSYDESGRDYWVSQLRSGMSGADAARQFFFSAEFTNANYSDDVYVTRLYRTFMGRTPDEGGKSYWVSQLTSGAMTREDVFNGFINSTEWANLCLQSGIISGGTQAPTISVEPSDEVTAFATRLYTTCLGRAADSAGVSWWATELANMRRTGTTAAKGFFFSDEYVSANHSDAEFVTALYRTFMGRECDQAGYDYWMGELASGCTRENVLERFAGCDEFGNICADAGIIR